jgi:hypothetical protein
MASPQHDDGMETRDVRVDDPSLSPQTNEALTDELQKAVGAKQAQVPAGTPHREHAVRPAGGDGVAAALGRNRLLVGITFVAALVVGAIVALATAEWWTLLIPVGVHALGTFLVAYIVIQMTTQPEAPDPALTARLEAEGVRSPERAFNDLVEEFSGRPDPRGATEVVSVGHNAQDGSASTQRSAMTPAGVDSEPVAAPLAMAVEWFVIVGTAVASIGIAIAVGDLAWLLPAVMLPICAGWVLYQWRAKRQEDQAPQRAAGDDRGTRRRGLLLVGGGTLAIELITLVVIILGQAGGR